jgi:hypothetical protein
MHAPLAKEQFDLPKAEHTLHGELDARHEGWDWRVWQLGAHRGWRRSQGQAGG